jgi:hypothetical protein
MLKKGFPKSDKKLRLKMIKWSSPPYEICTPSFKVISLRKELFDFSVTQIF